MPSNGHSFSLSVFRRGDPFQPYCGGIHFAGDRHQHRFSIPDLSGQWGRDMAFFEPPPSGPGPVLRAERKAG